MKKMLKTLLKMEVDMTHKNLYNLLKQIGIPVAYDHFDDDKKLTPPFMAYRELEPYNFKADNITFSSFLEFEIELVTSKKDVALENRISSLFTENNIAYDKTPEIWDADEKIYHIFYEI